MADGTLLPESVPVKRCKRCGETKPKGQFHPKSARCKPCHGREVVEWQRANPDKYKAKQARWHEKNKGKRKQYAQGAWDRMSPLARLNRSRRSRDRNLAVKYGITAADWDRMYSAQGGVCALCRDPKRTGRFNTLVVDHCHATGRARGLLCAGCNVALGRLGDSAESIERVLAYLRGGQVKV